MCKSTIQMIYWSVFHSNYKKNVNSCSINPSEVGFGKKPCGCQHSSIGFGRVRTLFLAQSSIDFKISTFLCGLFALNSLGLPRHFSATLN